MRSWIVLAVLGSLCAFVHTQCDIENGNQSVPFPNIENEAYESYQMEVEYTLPDAGQTDYYSEYYDILNRRGRVEAHQAGKAITYIYNSPTYEAWDIAGWDCTVKFLNETPEMFKDVQDDWLYVPDEEKNAQKITVGPSAMLKIAYDAWYKTVNTSTPKVVYMGEYESEVRGIKGIYWRRCDGEESYVDYVFTGEKYENPYGLKDFKTLPLRIIFGGKRPKRDAAFSKQQYEIIQFQPFISDDKRPFDLPRGKGCQRKITSDNDDIPEIPDFSGKTLQFSAEVIYQTVDFNGDPNEFVTYYNILSMALDARSQLLAFHTSPWDTTAPKNEPDVVAPVYVIFDMLHGYLYGYNLTDGQCVLMRERSYVPAFLLPRGRGGIPLTDPQVLYPNSEFVFLSEGINRGLKVNVFEQVSVDYQLNKGEEFIPIPKAIITHSYLQDNEVERNTNSVKNSLTQVQMRFIGRLKEKVMEIVTMNFYSFSTEIRNRQETFNIKRCYKNDDDYVWITLTFDADESTLNKIKEDVPSIQTNVLNEITMGSELNAARIPVIEVDFSDALYVTMQVLGRPPVLLDFLQPEKGKKITGTKEQEGISDEDTCATKCLESEGVCWGFSMCGAVCTFGADSAAKVEDTNEDCQLYKRDNGTFLPSTDILVQNLRRQVHDGMLKIVLRDKDNNMIQLQAGSIDVTDPGEDDRLFERIGNVLNPRMKVVKVGYKLKSAAGSPIKNMGRLRYDECQRICLDYRDCETVSYCLKGSECVLSKTYGGDIPLTDMEPDNMCNVLTRKYADNFDRSPGNVLNLGAEEILPISNVEDCARACLQRTGYKCLSFDHCPTEEKEACFLHTVHYPNPKSREKVSKKSPSCGHYVRKFSTEFKKNVDKRTVGSKLPPLNNLTLEECAKECIEYGKGTCFGYDFCQGNTILATSCILLDSDPNKMQLAPSPICNNYFRTEILTGPARPYTNSYAGGIGFLCFLIGGIVGVLVVFGIAYFKVNRR
ncbi:unnamed protein product [Larinioides sclopetarius]|uniref:Apple domain-containing protein n=1 Tax=Larinioides sclopetarius TaxID=280406 RepID=A0AAV2B2U2_9ARAC